MNEVIYRSESYLLQGVAMQVHSELGAGFLEAVYQEAFEIVLKSKGIFYEREKRLPITFMGQVLQKEYYADFVCYDKIIVETKAVSRILGEHEAQVLNYLKATGYKLGILMNFGAASFEFKRIVR